MKCWEIFYKEFQSKVELLFKLRRNYFQTYLHRNVTAN